MFHPNWRSRDLGCLTDAAARVARSEEKIDPLEISSAVEALPPCGWICGARYTATPQEQRQLDELLARLRMSPAHRSATRDLLFRDQHRVSAIGGVPAAVHRIQTSGLDRNDFRDRPGLPKPWKTWP